MRNGMTRWAWALSCGAVLLAVQACDRRSSTRPPPQPQSDAPPSRGSNGAPESNVDGGSDPASGPDANPTSQGERVHALEPDARDFARLEGEGFRNDCGDDAECVAGGCSGEVCSADPDVVTTCEVLVASLPAQAQCGCVHKECRWYVHPEGPLSNPEISSSPPPMNAGDAPNADVARCGEQMCKPGYTCVEYFGVAGPRGPMFQSCEMPCDPSSGGDCPAGLQCLTIADGPGSVCR